MDTFIVHMAGKTASQTIQQTLLASVPGCYVQRFHFFSDKTIEELRETCALPDAVHDNAKSVLSQCARAELCRNEILADTERQKVIISAYRDPFRQSVAALFQNLPVFLPEFDAAFPAVHWIDQLHNVFSTVFRKREELARSSNFIDRRRARPISGFTRWFEEDFNPTHGVDIYQHPVDDIGSVKFNNGASSFVIYKTESLEQNFDRIISAIPGVETIHRVDANRTTEKPSAELYRLFLETVEITDEMHSHYYENRFYKHFYG